MSSTWQFIDTGFNTGAFNMALDEQRARRLQEGETSPLVRLFRWKPWAISLGYNQRAEEIDRERCMRDGIDLVRRPTGGRAILHAEELTYSVVMPAGRRSVLAVYNDISAALVEGLRLYGVQASLQKAQPDFRAEYRKASSIPCFSSSARYEIEWEGKKLVGSAQRRFAGGHQDAVLQHGSILCGPAHRRLTDYLVLNGAGLRARVDAELRQKTTDLHEITGETPDMERLARCIRQGFERAWGIVLTDATLPEPIVHNEGQA